MMYYEFSAGNESYKLRLNTRNIVALEKQIGCNPLAIFGFDPEVPRVPTVYEMVNILHCSLQHFHHGITLDKAYDIFDEYIADGHSPSDFLPVIIEIYVVSGLTPKTEGNNEKN